MVCDWMKFVYWSCMAACKHTIALIPNVCQTRLLIELLTIIIC